MMKMTAGIALDKWKLPVFKRLLDEGNYDYTEHPGITDGTMLLKIKTADLPALHAIIRAAQRECRGR